MAIGQLFFAYAARHTHLRPLPNPYLHGAVVLGVAVQVLVGALFPGALEPSPSPWGLAWGAFDGPFRLGLGGGRGPGSLA